MRYEAALTLAKKAATFLEEREGNMSETEVIMHVSALDLALKTIAKRNGITLPE